MSDTFLILRGTEQDIVIKFSEILPSMYIGLNVRYSYCYQIYPKPNFLKIFFEKSSDIKVYENPSILKTSSSMWTNRQKDKQADMTMLLVVFQFLQMLLKICYHSGVHSCVS
jgi:hypothetical protein